MIISLVVLRNLCKSSLQGAELLRFRVRADEKSDDFSSCLHLFFHAIQNLLQLTLLPQMCFIVQIIGINGQPLVDGINARLQPGHGRLFIAHILSSNLYQL